MRSAVHARFSATRPAQIHRSFGGIHDRDSFLLIRPLPSLFLDAFYAQVRDRVLLTASWARHLIDVVMSSDKYLHVGLLVDEFPIFVTNKARSVTEAAPAEQRDKPAAPRWHFSTRATLLEQRSPPDPQAVAHDTHARERHGSGRYHRVKQAESRKRDRRQIVEKGPEQILPDRSERHTRQPQRLDDFQRAAFDENDIAGLDGDIGSRANGNAKIGLRERGRVIDAVADKRNTFLFILKMLNLMRLVLRKHFGKHLIDI
jgi:hypothetical protein